MIECDLARTVLAKAKGTSKEFVDLFVENNTTVLCTVLQGELHTVHRRAEQGAALRRINGTRSIHVHTSDLSEKGLEALVSALHEGSIPVTSRTPAPCSQVEDPGLEDLVRIAQEAANEVHRISLGNGGDTHLHATVMARAARQDVLIARSDNQILSEARYTAHMRVEAVARRGQKVRNGRRGIGAARVADLAACNRHIDVARQAAEAALLRLDAIDTPVGLMPVILGPGGPAAMLHEICGHALEADIAQHSGSAYYGALGERIASPLLTLIDDPRTPAAMPTYGFDDEGEPAQSTVLIKDGILLTHLYDRCTAMAAGCPSNGHARRLAYAYPPLPRMSTTYVAGSDTPWEEILAETDRGLFVQSINGGDTDRSGHFNLMVEEGYLIEGGRITAPIRGAVLSGHGPTVLRTIDRVGNDCKFFCHGYTCNKLNQFPLPVSLGQPTLRVPELLIWGG